MMWLDIAKAVLAIVGSFGGATVLLIAFSSWLGKVWAARLLEGDRSRYSAELEMLKSRYTRETELLRSELGRQAFEHQTHFAWYYERRLQVLAEIYKQLDFASDRVRDLVSPIQLGTPDAVEQRHQETISAYNDLARAYFPHKIFLDEELCNQLDAVVQAIRMALHNWSLAQSDGFKHTKEGLTLWVEAVRSMERDVQTLRKNLEMQFRILVSKGPATDAPASEASRE